MPNCKRCNAPTQWNKEHHAQTGKWVPFDPDTGEPHDCPMSDYNQGNRGNSAGAAAAAVTTVQQKRQPDTGYPNFRVTLEEWDFVKASLMAIKVQQDRLSEYYGDIVEHLKVLSSVINKEQKMADAEARYDQDKEDGLI